MSLVISGECRAQASTLPVPVLGKGSVKRFSPLSSAKVQKNGSKKVPAAAAATATALEGFEKTEKEKQRTRLLHITTHTLQ